MTDDPAAAPRDNPPQDDPVTVAYTPVPERRPEWARSAWLDPAPPPEPAIEPIATQPIEPVRPAGRRDGVGLGGVVTAAVLSAVLASGGTVVLLQSTGALDRPAGAGPSAPTVVSTQGSVAVDDPSAVVNAAAKVSPAVVRITASGVATDVFGGTIPETGVGSGVIYDADGWILTNRHVVLTTDNAISASLTVELKDGREFTGTVYGIDTLTDLAIVKVDATRRCRPHRSASPRTSRSASWRSRSAHRWAPTPAPSRRGSSRPPGGRSSSTRACD